MRHVRILTLALALAAGPVALAQPPQGSGAQGAQGQRPRQGRPPTLGALLARHAAELEIDAATLEAVRAEEEAARSDLERLHRALEQARSASDRETAQRALDARLRALLDRVLRYLDEEQGEALRRLLPPPPRGDRR